MTIRVDAGHTDGMTGAIAADPALRDPDRLEPPGIVSDEPLPPFETIYEQHVEFVWRCLRRLGVAPPALDDAVQDVFVVVHRRLAQFERRSSIKTWLFGIAFGVARNHRRGLKRRGDVEPLSSEVPDGAPGPEHELERREAMRVVDEILGTLDEEKRAVFVMVEIEDMTAREVAEAIGINVNTIYSRLRAARREFDLAVARRLGGDR
jgi:RNA polymerase sigma-70 factor, ECF subfamily